MLPVLSCMAKYLGLSKLSLPMVAKKCPCVSGLEERLFGFGQTGTIGGQHDRPFFSGVRGGAAWTKVGNSWLGYLKSMLLGLLRKKPFLRGCLRKEPCRQVFGCWCSVGLLVLRQCGE